jgi:hypothetical protein
MPAPALSVGESSEFAGWLTDLTGDQQPLSHEPTRLATGELPAIGEKKHICKGERLDLADRPNDVGEPESTLSARLAGGDSTRP